MIEPTRTYNLPFRKLRLLRVRDFEPMVNIGYNGPFRYCMIIMTYSKQDKKWIQNKCLWLKREENSMMFDEYAKSLVKQHTKKYVKEILISLY